LDAVPIHHTEEIKSAVDWLKDEIRKTPNRDDKIKATLLFADMGGIGKNELNELINQAFEDVVK